MPISQLPRSLCGLLPGISTYRNITPLAEAPMAHMNLSIMSGHNNKHQTLLPWQISHLSGMQQQHVRLWTCVCLSVQMLQQGFPPDSCDDDKRTGLRLASTRGHIPVVELLLAAGAPVDQLDSFGQTALSEACKFGQEDTITVLRRAGAK